MADGARIGHPGAAAALRAPGGGAAALRRASTAAAALALALAACAAPPEAPAPPRFAPDPAAPPVGAEPRPVPLATTVCPVPVFPANLRRSRVAGLTRVSGEVQPDGSVRSVVVIRSSGSTPAHKQLDRAAADALAACRFPPAPGMAPAVTTVNYRWAP